VSEYYSATVPKRTSHNSYIALCPTISNLRIFSPSHPPIRISISISTYVPQSPRRAISISFFTAEPPTPIPILRPASLFSPSFHPEENPTLATNKLAGIRSPLPPVPGGAQPTSPESFLPSCGSSSILKSPPTSVDQPQEERTKTPKIPSFPKQTSRRPESNPPRWRVRATERGSGPAPAGRPCHCRPHPPISLEKRSTLLAERLKHRLPLQSQNCRLIGSDGQLFRRGSGAGRAGNNARDDGDASASTSRRVCCRGVLFSFCSPLGGGWE
jgi:hypothetical protein